MRRLMLMIVTSVLATTLLAVPGASAIEAEPGPDVRVDEIHDVRPPKPKLRCHGAIGVFGGPKVKCRWTETEHPQAAGYKLIRVGGGERKVVFRTDDPSVTRFNDKDVEFDTRYRYRLIVVDEAGKRLQRSRWNRAIVHKPDVEVLKLDCKPVDVNVDTKVESDVPTDLRVAPRTKSVLCEWSAAQTDRVAAYQLWRLRRGHHRELVATVKPGQLSHIDHVPADTGKVIYAVLALDEHRDIVGRSRVAKVRF